MKSRIALAAGAVLAAGSVAAVPAAQAGSRPSRPAKVHVRIEGFKRTLLADRLVQLRRGEVRKDGHACSGTSGAGALQAATHGRWSAKWYRGLGFEVTRILGESDVYTTTHSYWELFVNGVASTTGVCGLRPHRGEQILFAAVPASGTVYPLAIESPRAATAGRAFTVTVRAYNAAGATRAVAGARVTAGSEQATSNADGRVRLRASRPGRLTIRVDRRGYIRDEATVLVRR